MRVALRVDSGIDEIHQRLQLIGRDNEIGKGIPVEHGEEGHQTLMENPLEPAGFGERAGVRFF